MQLERRQQQNNLKNFYQELYDVHKNHLDWEYGEIMVDFMGWLMADKYMDLAIIKNYEVLNLFKEFMERR